jgi:hypothetical protein
MAKLSQIDIDGVLFLNTSQRIDWSKMKNTPASLVSGTGHVHDTLYYRTTEVDDMFRVQEDRLSDLETQVETLAYKSTVFMGGGGSTSNITINSYNINTEVFSTISTELLHENLKAPGISMQRSGYFFNGGKITDKFDHFTLVVENTQSSPINVDGTIVDFAIQSKAFATDGASNWAALNVLLDTWEIKPGAPSESSGQVMLSAIIRGFTKGKGSGMLREYTHSSGISRDILTFTTNGDTVGLCKSSSRGFWLSTLGYNYINDYTTDSVSVLNTMVNNSEGAVTCTSQYFGVIGSGSHGTHVSKLTWSTLAISAMTDFSVDKTNSTSIEA